MNTNSYKSKIQYDPDTGRLTWIKTGEEAGTVVKSNGRAYRRVTVCNVNYAAHKLAWMLVTGDEPLSDAHIRFIDGDSLNIKADNLTYGYGRLSSRLKGIRYVIRGTSDIVHKFEVVSIRGDMVRWLNKFITMRDAQSYIDDLSIAPFRAVVTITNSHVESTINGKRVKYPSKNKAESVAIALSILLGL
jgi:hypothetical protein